MKHPTPASDERFAMPWSLDEDEPIGTAEAVEVIDLTDATHERRDDVHCPACLGTQIDTSVTTAGQRYDRCLACRRLWEVSDGNHRLVVATHEK